MLAPRRANSAPYRITPPRLPHVAVHVGLLGRPRLIPGDLMLHAQTLVLRVLFGPTYVEALARTGIGVGVDDFAVLGATHEPLGRHGSERCRRSAVSAGRITNPAAASNCSVERASERRIVAHPVSHRGGKRD